MATEIDIGQSPNRLAVAMRRMRVTAQRYLDASVPHRGMRWSLTAFLTLLYLARVVSYGGFYIITYGLFIHVLAQVLPLVTPYVDDVQGGGGELPTTNAPGKSPDDEYRPFVPIVQEFVVWKSITQALAVCMVLTLIPLFDLPVYWPILVFYSVVLFVWNMGARVKHMIQHGYVPWNAGKPKFVPKGKV